MGAAYSLTREQALEMRTEYAGGQGAGGAGLASLAVRYDVSMSTVYLIMKGEHRLVRDLPALPNRGNSFKRQDFGEAAATPRQAAHQVPVAPGQTRRQRMLLACPACGAKPREACVNPRAAYPRPMKSLHEERRG